MPGIIRLAARPMLAGGVLVILSIFVFERQLNDALELIGYDEKVASYIPFVRNIYLRFVLYYGGMATLDIAHFRMLDVVVLMSTIVWGTWLIAGIVFMSWYDDEIRLLFQRVSKRFQGRHLWLVFSWMFMLASPVILSVVPRVPVTNPEMLALLTYAPKAYFFAIAASYYLCGGFLFSLSILLVLWKAVDLVWVGIGRVQKNKNIRS